MPRTIKKYANRRLYDTETSQHVTLDGIRELIVEGADIEVIDETSGDDITRNILMQIIADQEQGKRPILSTTMLRHLIRFYGNPMQDMMGQYLEQSFESFSKQQDTMQKQFRDLMANTPMAAMQDMASRNMETWSQLQKDFLDSLTSADKKKSD